MRREERKMLIIFRKANSEGKKLRRNLESKTHDPRRQSFLAFLILSSLSHNHSTTPSLSSEPSFSPHFPACSTIHYRVRRPVCLLTHLAWSGHHDGYKNIIISGLTPTDRKRGRRESPLTCRVSKTHKTDVFLSQEGQGNNKKEKDSKRKSLLMIFFLTLFRHLVSLSPIQDMGKRRCMWSRDFLPFLRRLRKVIFFQSS